MSSDVYEGHDAGKMCICVGDHNPNPTHLQRHHIWPLGKGGPDTEENSVWLCPTTHENVHVLLRWWFMRNEEPPWEVRKFHSRYTREMAEKGWRAWAALNQPTL